MSDPRRSLPLMAILLLSPLVAGQCSDVPDIHVMSDDVLTVSGSEVWTGDVFVNGTLVIGGDLLLDRAIVVVGGAGFRIEDGGRLRVRGSTIMPHPNNTGFYLENRGALEIRGSRLKMCSDPDNPIIGIYQASGTLTIEGSVMVSSGLVHCMNSTVTINGSTIPGLVSTQGTCTVGNTIVDAMGLTTHGSGQMVVRDVKITSNGSFPSPVSAISSLNGGRVVMERVSIDGSYDGGVFARDGSLSAMDLSIELKGGLYGVRAQNMTIDLMEGLSVDGTMEGVTLQDIPSATTLRNLTVMANYTGLMWKGEGGLDLVDSEFEGSTYGGTLEGPSFVRNCSFKDNVIGLLAQGGSLRSVIGNSFIGFTKWGIEEQTWMPVTWPDNTFEPSSTAISNHAWWGLVNVSVVAEQGFTVEGALLEMRTLNEDVLRISQGPVGMLWGWEDPSSPFGIATDEVLLTAKWGTSSVSVPFRPVHTKDVTVVLPMSDLNVTSVIREGATVRVEVVCSGPEVRDARVTLYVDGAYRDSKLFDMGPNSSKVFSFELNDLEPGEREVTLKVFGRDEYGGPNGALLKNNELAVSFLVEEGGGGDTQYVLVGLCIMSVSVIALLTVIYVKRAGPKV